MGGHHGRRNRMHGGYRRDDYRPGYDYPDDGPASYPQPRGSSGPLAWAVVIVGLVVWTAIAWGAYTLSDSILGWIGAGVGPAVESSKNVATAAGVGKEIQAVAGNVNVSGFLEQAIAFLRVVMKPLIVIVWGIGAVILIAAPIVIRKMGGLSRLRHH